MRVVYRECEVLRNGSYECKTCGLKSDLLPAHDECDGELIFVAGPKTLAKAFQMARLGNKTDLPATWEQIRKAKAGG